MADDKVFVCGDPIKPGMIYWSGPVDPNKFPEMKLAIWETIKWRVRRFFAKTG